MLENGSGHLRVLIANERRDRLELLREHSQHNGHKLADVAATIVHSHELLMPAIVRRRPTWRTSS
jgi:hypothetical protein